ncbi:MAG: hypothetical protein R3D02_09390 [Hyphomicrobiales bacterium]
MSRRIARAASVAVEGPDVVTIDNSSDLDGAVAAFIAAAAG